MTSKRHNKSISNTGNTLPKDRSKRSKISKISKTKKKKERKNMAWWDKKHGHNAYSWHAETRELPKVIKDSTTLSVVLYKQSSLDTIAKMCLPYAKDSEFQVHYRGVQFVFRHPEDDRRLVFTIPTCFFNMNQKVTGGSVDFNYIEVSENSNAIAPISQAMAKPIADSFPTEYFTDQGFIMSVKELEMGSIHRHPGDFGFSTTDLDNKIDEPGIIFRTIGAQDKIQTDSVMYIPGENVKIVTTETRIVDVEQVEDGGIKGTYAETSTINLILNDVKTSFGFKDFFGSTKEQRTEYDFTTNSYQISEKFPELEDILAKFLDNSKYEPELLIDPSLIVQAFSNHKAVTHTNTNLDYTDELYDEYADLYGYRKGTNKIVPKATAPNTVKANSKLSPEEQEAKRINLRPKWRKRYTIGVLSQMGITPQKNKNIDGSTSTKDIIAVVTEMRKISKTDDEIRKFFVNAEYPKGSLEAFYAREGKQAKAKKEGKVEVPETTTVASGITKTPKK